MENWGRISVVFLLLVVFSQPVSGADNLFDKSQYVHPDYLYHHNSLLSGDPHGASFRVIETSLSLPYIMSFAVIGHERAHQRVALVNGAESTSVKWESTRFMTGETRWKGNFSKKQKMKMVTAGLNWNNNQAEDVVGRHLGGPISGDDLFWYGINQLNMTRYIMILEEDNPYHDINNWVHLVSSDDEMTIQQLRKDLRIGAAWQAASGLLPAISGMNWLMGSTIAVPRSWMNTQTELTDAGVVYSLSLWHKTKNNMVVRVRPGYGFDRTEDKAIYSLEGEINNIPIAGLLAGIEGGFSKTQGGAHYLGMTMKKEMKNRSVIALSSHWYSGYHRNNPSEAGGYFEVVEKVSLPF